MSVLLIVLAVLCVLVGIAGCILPVLPGPPLSFVALLLMRWSGAAEFDSRFLTIWGLATLAVTVLDYLLPAWLARRFGGSKQAAISMAGSTPILIEIGSGWPAASAFMRKASIWRPGVSHMESSSRLWTHRR